MEMQDHQQLSAGDYVMIIRRKGAWKDGRKVVIRSETPGRIRRIDKDDDSFAWVSYFSEATHHMTTAGRPGRWCDKMPIDQLERRQRDNEAKWEL